MLKSAKREDPHVKLLIIDLINYLTSLLHEQDRQDLISELYENQVGLSDEGQMLKLM